MIDTSTLKSLIGNPFTISSLSYKEIFFIISQFKEVLKNETILLQFSQKSTEKEIYVIGDIHGNLNSLINIIHQIENSSPELVIFLGDLVDRGPYQLECFLTVIILKILYPNKYIILRGNHESEEMNKVYGFYQSFVEKFGNNNRFNHFIELYEFLPYCLMINSQILCLHGGIPEDYNILNKLHGKKLKELSSLSKDLNNSLLQILWNDPKENMDGFQESFRGQEIYFFGKDVFNTFMKQNQLNFLIRGHEMFQEGYRWFFNKKLLSIFSSQNYRGLYNPNPASYAVIKNNLVFPKLIS